jgi:signal transduction histidine kinase
MIRSRFSLYYTQVYLVDPSGQAINLRAGTGDVGKQLLQRRHHLPVSSNSLNGRAVFEKKPVIVADTEESDIFLPNPLLPNTRSEMAIPLLIGDKVLGVLDMQSEIPNTLNEDNIVAFQVLAGQLSVAIQNATLFAQSEEARKQMEANARQITETGWHDFLDAIEREEKIGYTFNQVEVTSMENVNEVKSTNALDVPILVTGANVGTIQLVEEERIWTAQETEIVQAAAGQLAQHIDNLRLLAQAESYRAEAEQAIRRLTREGWEFFLANRNQVDAAYVYKLNEVKAFSGNGHHPSPSGQTVRQSLVVRDETIGQLAIDGARDSDEAAEILIGVAGQLSAHIENLRLSEQSEKRAHELETVAEVSATTATLLDPDRLLQTVVDLTKERFGLYHAHIYLADDAWQTLLLAAGAGEVGQKMVADNWYIPLNHPSSIVAGAARDRRSIIVNDVYHDKESGFLSNRLLPDTRSELAIPMIVSEMVLGVFDVQSNVAGYFTEEDVKIYTTLASQVSVALQNARLYVEQAATLTQLRELDRLKSSFLANMSHELRTPLNSILGFTDVILEGLDGPLTDHMDNDLRLVQKNGQHLLHLINDVLDMAKIEAGRMNLHPEAFKVHEVLDEVTSITSTLASEKNLSLFIDDRSNREIEIYADHTRLRQVMINLVNNSIKFTDKGKIALSVSPMDGARVLISVKDTGTGIPPEKLESVFQEFTQVDSSTTRKTGGTGLGLPISRRLVEMHGGRLWAESTGIPGEGSTFFVELPLEARITDVLEKQEK